MAQMHSIHGTNDRSVDQRVAALLADPDDYELLRSNWQSVVRENGLSTMSAEERMERARRAACDMLGLKYSEATRSLSAVERVASAMESGMIAPAQTDKQQLRSALFLVKIGAVAMTIMMACGPEVVMFLLTVFALAVILCVRYDKPPEFAAFLKEHINWIAVVEKDADQGASAKASPAVVSAPLTKVFPDLAPKEKPTTTAARSDFVSETEFGLRPEEFAHQVFDLTIKK